MISSSLIKRTHFSDTQVTVCWTRNERIFIRKQIWVNYLYAVMAKVKYYFIRFEYKILNRIFPVLFWHTHTCRLTVDWFWIQILKKYGNKHTVGKWCEQLCVCWLCSHSSIVRFDYGNKHSVCVCECGARVCVSLASAVIYSLFDTIGRFCFMILGGAATNQYWR